MQINFHSLLWPIFWTMTVCIYIYIYIYIYNIYIYIYIYIMGRTFQVMEIALLCTITYM